MSQMQEQNNTLVQTNKYTSLMKEYLGVKDQYDGVIIKLDSQQVQKETMHGRINEMRYILDQYKEELRDLGGDPDAADIQIPIAPVKNKNSKVIKKQHDDPLSKQTKDIMDKMNELRRWHNSKANILQVKIKDTAKVIEELEKKKQELLNTLKLRTG